MRFVVWTSFAASLVACAPQVAAPAKSPQQEAPATQSNWTQVEPAKQKLSLVPEPAGVPAPDASCQAFVQHPSPACGDVPALGRDALAEALAEKRVSERDQRLSCLETSADLPPGLVRTLRAELAPPGCADALALPYLEPRRPELERRIED